jgi:predicted acetyltransferase
VIKKESGASAMGFEFLDTGVLDGGDFHLRLHATSEPCEERGLVPAYDFRICTDHSNDAGQINLRVGCNDHLRLYGGNLGYRVHQAYRGHHLAVRSITLLLPIARHHGMTELWICCNPENWASRKTCERLGARLVEIIAVPPGNDLYDRGERANCRYLLSIR